MTKSASTGELGSKLDFFIVDLNKDTALFDLERWSRFLRKLPMTQRDDFPSNELDDSNG